MVSYRIQKDTLLENESLAFIDTQTHSDTAIKAQFIPYPVLRAGVV